MKKKTNEEKEREAEEAEHEAQFATVESLGACFGHAQHICGEGAPRETVSGVTFLIHELLDDDEADEERILRDVSRAYGIAKEVFETQAPTFDEVDGVYTAVFGTEEEEEEEETEEDND